MCSCGGGCLCVEYLIKSECVPVGEDVYVLNILLNQSVFLLGGCVKCRIFN